MLRQALDCMRLPWSERPYRRDGWLSEEEADMVGLASLQGKGDDEDVIRMDDGMRGPQSYTYAVCEPCHPQRHWKRTADLP